MEHRKPEIQARHIYEGELMSIWVAWQMDKPTNYALGTSEQAARENLSLQPDIESRQVDTGECVATCPKFPRLLGQGTTRREAERDLIRKINLESGKVDWKELFITLTGITPEWPKVCMEMEERLIRVEIHRRSEGK